MRGGIPQSDVREHGDQRARGVTPGRCPVARHRPYPDHPALPQRQEDALLRDVLLTVLLIAGLSLATAPVLAILIISFCLSFLPGIDWERRSLGVKVLAAVGIAVVLGGIFVFFFLGSIFNGVNGGSTPNLGPLATGPAILVVVLAFLALVSLVLVGYSYSMYRTFSDRLGPGANAGRFDRASAEIEDRIAEVAAAQWGNMTIYGGNNPFIGTGPRLLNEDWSIAIELDRASGPGRNSRVAHKSGLRSHRPSRIAPGYPNADAEGQRRGAAAQRAHIGPQRSRSCRRGRALPVGQPGH